MRDHVPHDVYSKQNETNKTNTACETTACRREHSGFMRSLTGAFVWAPKPDLDHTISSLLPEIAASVKIYPYDRVLL